MSDNEKQRPLMREKPPPSEPVERILSLLKGVKPEGQGKWRARCPAHDDKNPSLSITAGDDGRVLLYCHAKCTTKDVCKALGISEKDLFVEKLRPRPRKKEIVATYDFAYDIDLPIDVDGQSEDVVFVLRKRRR